MKKWTLESPGAGLALHLLLFSLVLAAVQYSEHQAASAARPPPPAQTQAQPARPHPTGHPAPQSLPVADAAVPRHPNP